MNPKLDPKVLRATSAEHAIECDGSKPHLELVEQEEPVVTRGVVAFASVSWLTLVRGEDAVVIVFVPGSTRAGVTSYSSKRYVSYHEGTNDEAQEMIRQLKEQGFATCDWRSE